MAWIIISAEQDTSLDAFRKLLRQGYDRVRFEALSDACEVCQMMDGQEWELRRFINGTRHMAPIFSHVHVNARSPMIVFDSKNLKPDVEVNYFGEMEIRN